MVMETPASAWYDRGPSMQSVVVSRVLRLGVRPIVDRVPPSTLAIRTFRTVTDAVTRLLRVDPRVRVEPIRDPQVESGGSRALSGEWLCPADPGAPQEKGAILYLHGGGFVMCSAQTHRPITSRLALDTGLPVLVPNYRLAPEHPFPAALDDTMDAYRWLLARGIPASRIVVAGDSAGGHLAASLICEASRTGLPVPACAVLYSPWVDLTCELSTERDPSAPDPYLSPVMAREAGRHYVGQSDFTDPRLSLLTRTWGPSLPPFLIQVGGAEMLRTEAERLAQLLTDAGADCELQVWPGQMHVFQLLHRFLPESRAAMQETARFITNAIQPSVIEAVA